VSSDRIIRAPSSPATNAQGHHARTVRPQGLGGRTSVLRGTVYVTGVIGLSR
jgi:hypothetical protein